MNTNIDLIFKSYSENSMLIDIPTEHVEQIKSGTKTVIVQKKVPQQLVINKSIFEHKHPKVYLYNKTHGVFGECYCALSFDNIDHSDDNIRKNYFAYGIVSKYNRDLYKENPELFDNEIKILNSKICLKGTCQTYQEFRAQVGLGNYIFFQIKDLNIFDTPLSLNDFYIARWGKNGVFTPSDKFKSPRGWCYAIKKDYSFTKEN